MSEASAPVPAWTSVANTRALEAASTALAAGSGPIGIDTERASGFRYRNRAFLVQVYRRDAGAFLVDPTRVDSFAPLLDAIGSEEWILHAADQDLPSLAELDLVPSTLFDTELASRLLGYERVGLGAVTERLLGVELEKAHSAVDWSTRPLPAEWLEYAALDVLVLPDLRDAIHSELEATGKLDYAVQEFEEVRTRPARPEPAEPWRRLSGISKLRGARQLAIARELWLARDRLARATDTAPGRLIPDASIIAATLANPRSRNELAKVTAFRGRASRTELTRWWDAILAGKTTRQLPGPAPREPGSMPNHRGWNQRFPEAAERLHASRAGLQQVADAQQIPVENLLKPVLLRQLAWDPPDPPTAATIALRLAELGARSWQIGLVSPIIAAAFVESE